MIATFLQIHNKAIEDDEPEATAIKILPRSSQAYKRRGQVNYTSAGLPGADSVLLHEVKRGRLQSLAVRAEDLRQVLSIKTARIGLDDSFFYLAGDSITAMKVVAEDLSWSATSSSILSSIQWLDMRLLQSKTLPGGFWRLRSLELPTSHLLKSIGSIPD